ncbi:MAG TPA: quercetin 2,3-dioxygenase [Caldilineaceae bacterium]|nr:quercetin 2,3-dioxygenase [Caldilineaceae bacterium]
MEAGSHPYMLAREEGQAIWFLGTLMTLKATGEQTGTRFSLIEQVLPPGFAPPLHIHHAEDEAFYLIEGTITFYCGNQTFLAHAGSFIYLPKEIPHAFVVEGDQSARLLQFTTPAGLEQFHVEMGEPAPGQILPPPSAPDIPKLLALASKYHFEVVGPPPNH